MAERLGVDWPPAAKGKTTQPAKDVWAAVAAAGGNSEASEKILKEKDWRFGYIPHCITVADIVASKKNGKAAAKAGVDKLYETFVFRDPSTKEVIPLSKVNDTAPLSTPSFTAKVIKGTGSAPQVGIPYKGAVMSGPALENQLKLWVETERIETDVAEKMSKAVANVSELKNKVFVLLGAGSEMGPFEFLLEQGATVMAVRTRKAQAWVEMEEFAKKTPGTLIIPVNKEGVSGADICQEPREIRDWVLGNLPAGTTDLTVGMYTYLDGEAHVRVSLGCDLIMQGIEKYGSGKYKTLRRAYLGSPSVSTAVSKAMCDASDKHRGTAGWFTKLSMAPQPKTTRGIEGNEDACIWHGYSSLQGPNYALAKCLQTWSGMNFDGPVAFSNGPFTYTLSVTHNATAKKILDAIHSIPPCEGFQANTARTVLALLLTYDTCVADDKFPYHSDFHRVTQGGCFHGGVLRCGYDYESSKILGATMLVRGSLGI